MGFDGSLESRTPILTEMIFILIVGVYFAWTMANFDINQHFYYVLPEQSFCNPEQQSSFCTDPNTGLYAKLGLQQGDQANIPDKYWQNLNQTATSFGILLGVVRAGSTFLMVKALHIKLRNQDFILKTWKIIVYAITVTIFPVFSFGDYFYYTIQRLPFPADWRWLDGVGFYPMLLKQTGDAHVMTSDVLIMMGIGTLIAVLLWMPNVLKFKKRLGVAKQIA